MLPDDLGRRAVHPGNLCAHRAPGLGRPPHEIWKPAETRLHHDDGEGGVFREYPFTNQARQLRLERLGLADIVLEIIGWPSGAGWRVSEGAACMNPEWQFMARAGLINRPVESPTKGHVSHRENHHLNESAIGRQPLNFFDREFRVLDRERNRRPQAWFPIQPLL